MTEANLYWTVFVIAFTLVALWETYLPRRDVSAVAHRWGSHAGLVIVSSVAARLVYRTSALVVAAAVQHSPYGLLNRGNFPFWLRCLLAFLLLDIIRYWQHYLFHSWSLLWQFHQVHHADAAFDLSTGLRFHPVEALLTQGSYLAMVALTAPPVTAVVMIELATICQDFFSHANASLPKWVEKTARLFLITPDIHSIHHSEDVAEQNTNFGTLFPWWDRIFRTYLPSPAAGSARLTTGLKGFQDDRSIGLLFMLRMPFQRQEAVQAEVSRASGASL
jgi:sterol desaturase/sphingolipid hydroxylase (fatty acid hydroxylase superfamily)